MSAGSAVSALSIWFWKQMATWSTLLKRDRMALEYWERIAAARPGDARALASVAHLKAQQGGRPQAIALLERAVALDPDQAGTWYNLGYLQQESQDHEAALVSFDRAIALDDRLDLAWYGKALSLIKTGRLEEAIAPLRRNTELQPMSPYGFYQLGHVYHRLGRREQVARLIQRLSGFEPQVARQLARGGLAGTLITSPASHRTEVSAATRPPVNRIQHTYKKESHGNLYQVAGVLATQPQHHGRAAADLVRRHLCRGLVRP